eukprot:Platyproteum_vivax@DN7574_c0_g1_i1.p1
MDLEQQQMLFQQLSDRIARLKERLEIQASAVEREPKISLPESSSGDPKKFREFLSTNQVNFCPVQPQLPEKISGDCKKLGEFLSTNQVNSCPVKPQHNAQARVILQDTEDLTPSLVVPVTLCKNIKVHSLVDSGATGTFIDSSFVSLHSLVKTPKDSPAQTPIILGTRWLKKHNPPSYWQNHVLTFKPHLPEERPPGPTE